MSTTNRDEVERAAGALAQHLQLAIDQWSPPRGADADDDHILSSMEKALDEYAALSRPAPAPAGGARAEPYVPKVGDVVTVACSDRLTYHEWWDGAIGVVEKQDPWIMLSTHRIRVKHAPNYGGDKRTVETISLHPEYVRPATPAERAAAGLANPAPTSQALASPAPATEAKCPTVVLCDDHAGCELIPGPFCPQCAYWQARKDGQESAAFTKEYAANLRLALGNATPRAGASEGEGGASARTALAEAKGADPAMAEYIAASLAWWLDDSDEAGNFDGPSWQRYWNAYYALSVEVRRGGK